MALWAPVLHATADRLALRELGESFAGRHVIPRYRGYMKAQAERLSASAAVVTAAEAAGSAPS